MTKRYFTLLERDNSSAPWRIEFGAYDREDVESELDDRRDHDVKKSNLKIVQTANASQAAIDAKLAELNSVTAALLSFPRSAEYQRTYASFRSPATVPANSGPGEAYERGYHGKPARPAWKKYIQPARDIFAAAYQAGQDDHRDGRML